MESVNKSYKLERVADDGKTLKPLEKSDLLQKRGMAVLVAHTDGTPMLYGMDRVAAVIDTVPIYGESHMGIVAIYGRGLTLGGSDYGIAWVAYDYNSSEKSNSSSDHYVDANKMVGKDEDNNVYTCSACGEPWTFDAGTPADYNMHYCPNCGAKMDKEAE
jgi:DNA-directed RNA polymerase subunit RPC12/RpoP